MNQDNRACGPTFGVATGQINSLLVGATNANSGNLLAALERHADAKARRPAKNRNPSASRAVAAVIALSVTIALFQSLSTPFTSSAAELQAKAPVARVLVASAK